VITPGKGFEPAQRTAAGPTVAPPRAPTNTPGGGGYVPEQPAFSPGGGGGGYDAGGGFDIPELPESLELPELPDLPGLTTTPSSPEGSSNVGIYIVGGIAIAGLGFLASVWLRRVRKE